MSPDDVTQVYPSNAGKPDTAARQAAEAQVAQVWQVGDVILDTYDVTDILGEGGFGTVYKVHHRNWNVDLAVKSPRLETFLPGGRAQTVGDAETVAQTGSLEDFLRECETWINLGLHPHIVSCYYVRTLGHLTRIFIEYVEGGSLKDWIRSRKLYEGGHQKALERILDIAIQMAWGLHYAHEQGLVHQDVKPANVMMTPDGTAKVTDFGLAQARAMVGETQYARLLGESVVVPGAGLMTPAYCSPEQANGRPLTSRTDIWSWGVSVLEMFAGEITWGSGALANEALKDFIEMRAKNQIILMPTEVQNLLGDCFQYEFTDRPRDMLKIATMLQDIYREEFKQSYARAVPKALNLRTDSLNNYAISLLDLGKEQEAVAAWKKALAIDPHHLEVTFNYGYFQWARGQITDDVYVSQMEELERSEGTEPNYYSYLAWIHLERGDIEELESLRRFQSRLEDEGFQRILETKNKPVGRRVKIFRSKCRTTSLSFSPDGYYFLAGNESALENVPIRIWEVESGSELPGFVGGTFIHRGVTLSGNPTSHEVPIKHVTSIDVSPNGDLVVSASGQAKDIPVNSMITIWEMSSKKALISLAGHTSYVNSVVFSPNGRYILSGSDDQTLRLWDMRLGMVSRCFKGHSGKVLSVGFSPDGHYAVSSSSDHTVRLWNVTSGREAKCFRGHTLAVKCAVFSPEGTSILSCSNDKTIRLWNVASGQEVRRFEGHSSNINSISFSPDGRYIVSGSDDKKIRLWDVKSGKAVRCFGCGDSVWSVKFSPNGRYILSSSRDANIILWEIHYPEKRWVDIHPYPSLCEPRDVAKLGLEQKSVEVFLHSALRLMASGDFRDAYRLLREGQLIQGYSRDREILNLLTLCGSRAGQLRGLRDVWCLNFFEGHHENITAACFSNDGQYILSGSLDKTIRLWNVASGKEVRRFEGDGSYVYSVRFSPDSRYILSGHEKSVRLWEINSGDGVKLFEGHGGGYAASFSPDGQLVVISSINGKDTKIRWLSVANGEEVGCFVRPSTAVGPICFSPDGQYILFRSDDKNMSLIKIMTKDKIKQFCCEKSWSPIAFSPDGQTILSGGTVSTLRLWDVKTGRQLNRHFRCISNNLLSRRGGNRISVLTFSPDGHYALSSGGRDGEVIHLWDIMTGKELKELKKHVERVVALDFSPNSQYALSAGYDKMICIWEFDWKWDFPNPADWVEDARPYLEIFLSLHTPYDPDGLSRVGPPTWTDADFQQLLTELGYRGYGWLRPEGVRRELEKMARDWQGPPSLQG
jgi:WD40 repeat protein/serine/threonine protein kinase